VSLETGSLFLAGLRRRARADTRLHLIETTAIALVAGALSSMRIDEFRQLTFGTPSQIAFAALIAAAAWLILGSLLYHVAQGGHRAYIAEVLSSTGLLYLALEHEPGAMLPALTRQEKFAQLTLRQGAGHTFRQRMLNFLRCYPACSSAAGFHPYPALWRLVNRALTVAAVLLGAGYLYYIVYHLAPMFPLDPSYPPKLRLAAGVLLVLILARATIGQARRTGLFLALCDVLLGDEQTGYAVLSRR